MIENSELHFLDKCGHAPMMERPDLFNIALESFIRRVEDGTFIENRKAVTVLD